jgi:ubiquinone/menaquinone biosynthesis C-methylase UbiE
MIFKEILARCVDQAIKQKIEKALSKLEKINFDGSWEWEDVEFWDREYRKNWLKLESGDSSFFEKRLAERILQRRIEMEFLSNPSNLPDGVIVEVGAGTATYTKEMLENHPESTYIAVDMSFYGLKIRRRLLGRSNALYILGSVDRLPLCNESVSAMLLIGILHHSEHKEHTLPSLMKLITPRGLIYLDEVLHRPSFLNHDDKILGDNISQHEECVYGAPLKHNLSKSGEVVYEVEFNTPFYNFAIKKMLPLVTASRGSYQFFRYVDTAFRVTLGRIIDSFKAGEISVIWRKSAG